MRRLPLVLVLLAPAAAGTASEQKVQPPQQVAKAQSQTSADWYTRGGWDRTAFNRNVQIEHPGRTAFRTKGRFSVEVVPSGEKGDVVLRFFDATGTPIAQVPGHVRGIGPTQSARTRPGGEMSNQWNRTQKWADAGFDAASPFAAKALADGSVKVEFRSSKFPGLFIEGTLPVAPHAAR